MPACRRPAPILASAIPARGRRAVCVALATFALAALASIVDPPAAQTPAAPCAIETAARVVAVARSMS
jgi:hypothetical protein